jgi:hypothetical protein
VWHDAELDGSSAAQTLNRLRKSRLGNTVIAPLHRKLEGNDGKGILIRVKLGSVVVLGVEADKWLEEEEVPQAWFSSCTTTARA